MEKLICNLSINKNCLYPYLNITEAKTIIGGRKEAELWFKELSGSQFLLPLIFPLIRFPSHSPTYLCLFFLKAITPIVHIPVLVCFSKPLLLRKNHKFCFTN